MRCLGGVAARIKGIKKALLSVQSALPPMPLHEADRLIGCSVACWYVVVKGGSASFYLVAAPWLAALTSWAISIHRLSVAWCAAAAS